jgi:serine/threonine protein kinase
LKASSTRQAPEPGRRVAGRYQLVRFLGRGGFAAVYEASAPDGTRVAVKLVLAELASGEQSENFIARFRRESELTGSLNDPHIVALIESGFDEAMGLPFMVMPLMEGFDLKALIKRIGPLQPAVAARIVRQACAGMKHAHEAGVIHRDIKPANLFLDHDAEGHVVVRLLDFGIARSLFGDSKLTRTGTVLGSPSYMAPEQIADSREADSRSDVWSIGVTLYHALSGVLPFQAASSVDVLMLITEAKAARLQDHAPWIDPALAAIVHGALIADADARCPSAEALSRALEPFAGGSDDLDYRMFQPLEEAARAQHAARAELPTVWPGACAPEHEVSIRLAQQDPLLGQSLGGRYTLIRSLGRGGMGSVYEARTVDGERVAVKVILADEARSEQARQRFLREAKAASAVRSPNVVKLIDVGEDEARKLPFIVMELLCGSDLAALLKRVGALTPKISARLFVQACRGLGAAHASGFVHRDVKPGNLFLHELASGEVVLKVCDFGIAKQIAADSEGATQEMLTTTGSILGSPTYMSPEQIKTPRDLDERTDVWSLGASLYHVLTGSAPWDDCGELGEIIFAIFTQDVPHVQSKAPWVDAPFAALVHRAMRRPPEERHRSMAEMEQGLLELTDGSTSVTIADLVATEEDERRKRAPRASDVGALTTRGVSALTRLSQPSSSRSLWPVALGGVVVAAGVAGISWWRAADQRKTVGQAAVETIASMAAATPDRSGIVSIHPPDARVSVDGRVQPTPDGTLVLRGAPGDSFTVIVSSGDRRVEKTVLFDRDGKLSLGAIELPPSSFRHRRRRRSPPPALPPPALEHARIRGCRPRARQLPRAARQSPRPLRRRRGCSGRASDRCGAGRESQRSCFGARLPKPIRRPRAIAQRGYSRKRCGSRRTIASSRPARKWRRAISSRPTSRPSIGSRAARPPSGTWPVRRGFTAS